MTIRLLAASLLAATVLGTGAAHVLGTRAAHACDTPDRCPPGTAPSYPVMESASNAAESATPPAAPLRLNPQRRKSPPKRAAAQPVSDEPQSATEPTPTALPLPRPRPDTGDGWATGVYAMDPAGAPPAAEAEPPAAFPRSVTIAHENEVNDIDRMADPVRVVSAEEVNEIDLAASPRPPAETTGKAQVAEQVVAEPPVAEALAATTPQGLPTSWIAGLVLAFGGAAAAASALFIRQTRS